MSTFPILSVVTFLPLVGAIAILTIRGDEAVVARNARWVALWASLSTFIASLFIWHQFDTSTAEFQFQEEVEWMAASVVGIWRTG